MLRDINYIIKKIIIGVGIALILMLIKGSLFLTVDAKGLLTPDDFYIYDYANPNGYTPGMQQYWHDSYNYYGRLFGSNPVNRSRLLWTFDTDLDINKSYDFNFTGYFSLTTNSSFNVRGYIEDSTGFVNSCYIDSSIWSRLQPSSSQTVLSTDVVITCENVQLNSKDFNFTLLNVINEPSSFIGISKISYKENDSNKIESAIQEQTQTQQQTNDILESDDTSESEESASGFFDDFSSNSHGLSGIISSPLRLIRSISSSTCSPLSVPLPFVDNNVSLPCMSTIYTTHFNSFLVIYRIITTGLIGYWILIRLFGKVKDFQNPESDKVEVFDL